MPEHAAAPGRGFDSAPHWLARPSVTCNRIAPMTAIVTAAPRKSLARCGGGSWGLPKPGIVDRSLLSCRSCRRPTRVGSLRGLILGGFPREHCQEPHAAHPCLGACGAYPPAPSVSLVWRSRRIGPARNTVSNVDVISRPAATTTSPPARPVSTTEKSVKEPGQPRKPGLATGDGVTASHSLTVPERCTTLLRRTLPCPNWRIMLASTQARRWSGAITGQDTQADVRDRRSPAESGSVSAARLVP
jgi:hypothetical protein